MLYAQTWHSPTQFEEMYGKALEHVKEVMNGTGGDDCFFGLYEKVALSGTEREELAKPMLGTEAQETRKVVVDIIKRRLGL